VLADLAEVLAIERTSFPDPWSADGFRSVLLNKLFTSIGIFQGDLLGYLVSMAVEDELHILNIAVKPDKRRRGYGEMLLKYILNFFQKKLKFVYLEARVSNINAIDFYLKRGFKNVGIRKKYYPNGEDAVLMTLNVKKQIFQKQ
jgi:ribosomal-protein-alanine N-acetyltransferase